jgi:hypothetical protein
MGEEHSNRRKRVSDGGLQPTGGDANPVRILPEGNSGNGNTNAPTNDEGEWVIELGGRNSLDDPTTRLPLEPATAAQTVRSDSIYTAPTAPYPVAALATPTPAASRVTPPQSPTLPPYAAYDPSPLQAPSLSVGAGRSLAEREERDRDVEKQPVKVARQGPTACSILAITFGVIAISCSLFTFAVIKDGFSGLGNLFGWVPNIFGPPTVAIDTSRPSIIEKVSALSRLETVHYSIEKVVTGQSTGFLASDNILLVAHGDIIAGVDLSKLKEGDIVTATNTVTITLPKAEVFNPKNVLDSSKTYIYNRSRPNPLFTDAALETRIRDVAAEQILQAAIEDGVLTKAQKNAEEVLRSLISGLGYKEVIFKTAP